MEWGTAFLHAIGHESTFGVVFLAAVVGGLALLAFMASRAERGKRGK
ncbi:MAG TPA: hypothetical protein VNL95_02575 [Dehalococcoidia bacterium]|nr:hypothetical protein [Dehalococcoidia bacterium]